MLNFGFYFLIYYLAFFYYYLFHKSMINKERETLSESGDPLMMETLLIMEEYKKNY